MPSFRQIPWKLFITLVLCFQLSACGTILYPERHGQTKGRLDTGVVLLDGVGLLVFLIPGIIAFAVDFSTGAIYLPNSAKNTLGEETLRTVYFDPANYSQQQLEAIIRDRLGRDFRFDDQRVERFRLDDTAELPVVLAQLKPPAGSRQMPAPGELSRK